MAKYSVLNKKDLIILKELVIKPEGVRVETLTKLIDLTKRTIYRRLNILRNKGLIENIFPIWKIVNGKSVLCQSLLKEDNIFELHNLSYVVTLPKVPDWWARRSRKLIKVKGFQFKQIDWGKGSSNPYQQLINENYVIQTYPESVIVMCRKRYYANNPYELIIKATNEFLDLWNWFEERMRFKFFIDGIPQIKLRSNDFNRIGDVLSEHCKKQNKGFLIEIKDKGKVWVDFSEPFGKEANYPEAQEKLEKVTKDLLLKDSYLPSEIKGYLDQTANQIRSVTENQLAQDKSISQFAVALNKHIPAYEGMTHEVRELKGIIKELKEEITKLRSKNS